jgi:DNA-binding HxlR family transcriptional regulator
MKKALFCPLQGVIDVISKKWALLIINEIGNHEKIRFNELKRELRFITSKTLTNTLKELEANGLIIRTVFNEIPPRVEYLTNDGKVLHKNIIGLLRWAAERDDAIVKRCSCVKS